MSKYEIYVRDCDTIAATMEDMAQQANAIFALIELDIKFINQRVKAMQERINALEEARHD